LARVFENKTPTEQVEPAEFFSFKTVDSEDGEFASQMVGGFSYIPPWERTEETAASELLGGSAAATPATTRSASSNNNYMMMGFGIALVVIIILIFVL